MTDASVKQSIADLTTSFKKTTGDVPPLLIGPTTTVVGDRLFLFGGRLKSSRQIFNHLYVLSLTNFSWTRIVPGNDAPTPRYFHSANRYGNKIVFYGGMTVDENTPSGQQVLGDVFILNLHGPSLCWEYPKMIPSEYGLPQPRYAHNASVINDQLVIFGGQDIGNSYIAEMNVLNLKQKSWHAPIPTQSHYGAYRSAAMTVTPSPRTPLLVADDFSGQFVVDDTSRRPPKAHSSIYMYSNYNFDDLRREMDIITVSRKGAITSQTSCSPALLGEKLPPPLRFPKTFSCGKHMLLSGAYLTHSKEQFQLWAFDMSLKTWTRIETESLLAKGSWLRGELYEDKNQFLVFGNEQGSMREDYKERVINFQSCFSIDIEAFGIYRPPVTSNDIVMQGLGLAILNNTALADLTIVSTDNEPVPVNSAILLQRWPSITNVLRPLRSLSSNDSAYPERKLTFPGTGPVLKAFLHFIYTDHISTAQQHRPDILSHLLLLSDLLGIKRLKDLTIYALHQKLNKATASLIYDSAALARATSLQVRAMRIMIDANLIQLQPRQAPKATRPPSLLIKPSGYTATPRITARRRQLPPITIHRQASQSRLESPQPHLKDIVEKPLPESPQQQPQPQPEPQPEPEPQPQPQPQSKESRPRTPKEAPRSYLKEILEQAESEARRLPSREFRAQSPRSHLHDIIEQTRQTLPSNLSPTTPPTTPPPVSLMGEPKAKTFPFWPKKRLPNSPGSPPADARPKWIQRTIKF